MGTTQLQNMCKVFAAVRGSSAGCIHPHTLRGIRLYLMHDWPAQAQGQDGAVVRAAAVQLLCSWARSSVANCGAMATLGAGQILCTVSLETIVCAQAHMFVVATKASSACEMHACIIMFMISLGHSDGLLSHRNWDGQM